jgi:hypothetical protein
MTKAPEGAFVCSPPALADNIILGSLPMTCEHLTYPAISDNADRTSLGEPNVPQVYDTSISTPSFLSNSKSGKTNFSYPLIQQIPGGWNENTEVAAFLTFL